MEVLELPGQDAVLRGNRKAVSLHPQLRLVLKEQEQELFLFGAVDRARCLEHVRKAPPQSCTPLPQIITKKKSVCVYTRKSGANTGIFLDWPPLYSLRQGLLLSPELTDLAC